MHNPHDPLAVLLLGPTGSGKTVLSLALAERFNGEIVSCDSVAVYRGMDLGTAKPTPEERARIPHHLVDIVNPDHPFTAGEYSRRARTALREIANRGKFPIVTGGTGLYLRALTEGLFTGPARQEDLRQRLRRSAERHGSAWLHRLLSRLDPEMATRIHANDAPKLIRAIEVCLASRGKMTELWQQRGRDRLRGFRIVRLGLDPERPALYQRINRRAQKMFDGGLIEETEHLLEKYGDAAGPLSSLGYRQAVQFLRGEVTREQALQAAQQAHRNYAKRQMTWFRSEPEVRWLRGFGDEARVREEGVEWVLGMGV